MIRNLKMLGLALVAVFAMSAMAASAASAANDVFTSEVEPTDLTGEGLNPTFHAAGTSITCEKSTYAGTIKEKKVTEVTVHPVYDPICKVPGITEKATVDSHGCDYILTGKTEVNTKGQTDATVSVECTSGSEILITTGVGITIHVGAQGPKLGVTYDKGEENGKDTVTVTATVEDIVYSCTGAFCGLLKNNGNGADGLYTDDVTVTGFEDTKGFIMDSVTHTWSGEHGKQVGITVSEGE